MLFDSDLLHDPLKRQHRIADFPALCDKDRQSSLLWTIMVSVLFSRQFKIPEKKDSAVPSSPVESFFLSWSVFTADLPIREDRRQGVLLDSGGQIELRGQALVLRRQMDVITCVAVDFLRQPGDSHSEDPEFVFNLDLAHFGYSLLVRIRKHRQSYRKPIGMME